MKDLIKKLRRFNESNESPISLELFKEILSKSYDFSDEFNYLEERIEDGEKIKIRKRILSTGEVVAEEDLVMICTKELFNDIVISCSSKYRNKYINDFLQPFFDDNAFDKAIYEDKGLAKEVLDYDDINNWEFVEVDGTSYVIMM